MFTEIDNTLTQVKLLPVPASVSSSCLSDGVSRVTSAELQACHNEYKSLEYKSGHVRFDHSINKMSSKSNCFSVCPGSVLSVFCLLLYSAGFIRIEVKFNDQEERLTAVEEVDISQMKRDTGKTSIEGKLLSSFVPEKPRLTFLPMPCRIFSVILKSLHLPMNTILRRSDVKAYRYIFTLLIDP